MFKSILVKNFMGYKEFETDSLGAINVFIGKNDTGKTSLLKLLYTAARTLDIYSRKKQSSGGNLKKILAEKLTDVFVAHGKKGLGDLVNKSSKEKLSVDIRFKHQRLNYSDRIHFSFGETTTNTILDGQDSIEPIQDSFRCLFIPAKEVLTALKAIRATRDNLLMPEFDDTYLDLIRALVIPVQKGNYKEELRDVNERLEALLGGRIEQIATDEFIFKKGNTEFAMPLTAEGIKKIGVLTTLIRNRQLNAQSVLFMDEPETTLHPEAIRELVEMLILMAKAGIQIFIATHNQFVLKQLYISARKYSVAANCYSLSRDKGQFIQSICYNLLAEFPNNAISDAAIRMADEELDMDMGA